MNLPQARDNSKSGFSEYRVTENLRPLPGGSFASGTVVYLVPLDQQQAMDYATVAATPPGDLIAPLMGAVPGEWITNTKTGGFDGLGSVVAPSALARGTTMVDLVDWGQHGAVLVDQSGGAATAIVHGTPLTSSQISAGSAQGAAGRAFSRFAGLGVAVLPAAGIGSTIGAGALVQPAMTFTLTAVPTGSTVTASLQVTGNNNTPGVPVLRAVTITNAAGATVTIAAAALAAAINADPLLRLLYIATAAIGVVTVTALGTGNIKYFPLSSSYGTSNLPPNVGGYSITASGTGGNGLATAIAVTGGAAGTTSGNFAGGTGYLGTVPVFIGIL